MTVLIDATELADLRRTGAAVVVLDVRWRLGGPSGREAYRAGHVPGAVFVDLDRELAAPPSPQEGRHPLPAIADLQAAARRWGLTGEELVVAYDDDRDLAASRAWWLLRWAGLEDVRLLDGGLAAWAAAGGELEPGDVTPEPGTVTLSPGHLPTIAIDEVPAAAAHGVLLDARAAERYRGEIEPIDPQAGHVPGAVSAPTTGNLDADGRFLPPDALRERFRTVGVDGTRPVAVYCGSGVTAAHQIAALALAGVDAALYPGSWSQWSADETRPVAVGEG